MDVKKRKPAGPNEGKVSQSVLETPQQCGSGCSADQLLSASRYPYKEGVINAPQHAGRVTKLHVH